MPEIAKETEMTKVRVVGLTEPHVGEIDKPNEDAWLSGSNSEVIAIADGITRSRLPDESYPAEYATVAPTSFVKTVVEKLNSPRHALGDVLGAVTAANEVIARENRERCINQDTVDYQSFDYLGTTGCLLCINSVLSKAFFAYLGDVIAISLPKNGSPRLLTRDQLRMCHRFSYTHFSKSQKAERLLWQRKEVRNNYRARNPEGKFVGFGAFTGEPEALKFLEISEFKVNPGDRFILASDALRVVATIGEEDETISSYSPVLGAVREASFFEEWPKTLIGLIRCSELEKQTRSDDATIVAVEIL
jgi:serine/threonine protein phosphatase PrpC